MSPWQNPPELDEGAVPVLHAPRGEMEFDIRHYTVEEFIQVMEDELQRKKLALGLASALAITGWTTAVLIWVF